MGKHRPAKLRERRTGASPYAKKAKTPCKYGSTVLIDPDMVSQTPPRRRRDHVQAELYNMEKFK